jgi:hypothetical protein
MCLDALRLSLTLSKLKYSRLKGRLPEILAKDQVSSIAVGSRVIVRHLYDVKHLCIGHGHPARHGSHPIIRRCQNQLVSSSFCEYNRHSHRRR